MRADGAGGIEGIVKDYEIRQWFEYFASFLRRAIKVLPEAHPYFSAEIYAGDWSNRVYRAHIWLIEGNNHLIDDSVILFHDADREPDYDVRGAAYMDFKRSIPERLLPDFDQFVSIAKTVLGQVTVKCGYKRCGRCGSVEHFDNYSNRLCPSCEQIEKKHEQNPVGYVYVYEAVNMGFYKIGRTWDINQRHRALVKLPFEIRQILALETNDPVGLENRLHSAYHDKRVNGEWFTLSKDDLSSIVEIADAIGAKTPISGGA